MPRLAANLTMLFQEHPFPERIDRAAAAGFRAVEFMFPYGHDLDDLRRRLDHHGLAMALHNLPAGDWAAGERGIATMPERQREFRDGVERAVEAAGRLGAPRLNCLVGRTPAGVEPARVHAVVLENLAWAAARLQRDGLELLIEPLNPFDMPGFWLSRSAQALALIDDIGAPNLKLQFDLYHAQRTEGELAGTLARHLPRIGHVQIADNPGRHEPGSGELNWPFLFATLDRLGYAGWVGCEYLPAAGTEAGLGWRQRFGVA